MQALLLVIIRDMVLKLQEGWGGKRGKRGEGGGKEKNTCDQKNW